MLAVLVSVDFDGGPHSEQHTYGAADPPSSSCISTILRSGNRRRRTGVALVLIDGIIRPCRCHNVEETCLAEIAERPVTEAVEDDNSGNPSAPLPTWFLFGCSIHLYNTNGESPPPKQW